MICSTNLASHIQSVCNRFYSQLLILWLLGRYPVYDVRVTWFDDSCFKRMRKICFPAALWAYNNNYHIAVV